jgi:predicted MPP superfamily phosphohydrolase
MNPTLTRRQTIKVLAAGAGALALGLYTWGIEPHWLEFTHSDLSVVGLPRELEGRTLAQISDLHVGPAVDDAYVIESLQRVGQLAPDFIAFTGDWITYRGLRRLEQLRRVMKYIPHGRLGTVGILGNHDYGINWRMVDVAQQVSGIAADVHLWFLE